MAGPIESTLDMKGLTTLFLRGVAFIGSEEMTNTVVVSLEIELPWIWKERNELVLSLNFFMNLSILMDGSGEGEREIETLLYQKKKDYQILN